MKAETLKKSRTLCDKIIESYDYDLKRLSRIAVTTFDDVFESYCKEKDVTERSEMARWVKDMLLAYCIAMYDDTPKFILNRFYSKKYID